MGLFVAYCSGGAVAGIDFCFVGQGKELFSYAADELRRAAAWKICSADRFGEKRVADEGDAVFFRVKANAAGRVARSVEHEQFYTGQIDHALLLEREIFRLGAERRPGHGGQIRLGLCQHFGVEFVNVDLHIPESAAQCRHASDVICMAVSEDYRNRIQFLLLEKVDQPADIETGVDHQTVGRCLAAAQNIAVGFVSTQDQDWIRRGG